MKRRAKTGRNAVKTQRRKTLSRRDAPKSSRNGRSATAHQETDVVRLTRELHEAREQQAATSEVLGVISSSPGELGPVFDAILENATRICGGRLANLFLYSKREHAFRLAAQRNAPAAYAERWAKNPVLRIGENPRNPLERLARTRRVVAIPDLMVEPGYINRDPRFVALVEGAGARTHVLIPMLKEGELVGGIAVYRQKVLPFTDRQIELLRNFAAQAVIAIENTRLFNELRESLQQQTATSDILKVISGSPGELEPVFSAMLEKAVRICGANFGNLYLREGDAFRIGATYGTPPTYAEYLRTERVFPLIPEVGLGLLARTKKTYHLADISTAPSHGDKLREATINLAGARTLVGIPMLKDAAVIGALVIYRQEVRPFTEKQIELVQNFAAQAVIAIENARLLNELRQRTDDLTESLEQQTATSEVLKVISSSPGQLEPVFETMLANATRICEAAFGSMLLVEGNGLRRVALHNAPPLFVEFNAKSPLIPLGQVHDLNLLFETRRPVHIADAAGTEDSPIVKYGGARTLVIVPMLKEREVVGVIGIYRQEVRPFTDKQIELVTNFAAQAVIAIENTRLLSELRQRTDDLSESLEQQTATSEVLKVISSSPGELQQVFQVMLENATRICEAKIGILFRHEGGAFTAIATLGVAPAYAEYLNSGAIRPSPTTGLGRVATTKQTIHVLDTQAESAYAARDPLRVATADLGGARTLLNVPMIKDGQLVGAIGIYRQQVRPFTEKQIELVTNFAAQAVIAIENTRLLSELRESLQQQTATADVLKVISRSTFDLQTVLGTLVETAVRVCEADIGNIARPIGNDEYKIEASYGQSTALYEELARQTLKIGKGSVIGRTALNRAPVHILDAQTDPDYELRGALKIGDYHTMLGVPLVREGNIIGVFGLARKTVRAFTEKQIDLVATFADQAVIAIENVRLFDEVQGRTRELAESLEDLRTTQDRLVQTQKLALLGQLTAGIAHEIKNPLNFVNNFSGISTELIEELRDTLKGVPLDDKVRGEIEQLTDTLKGNFDKVVHHGRRADAIVKNMLQHSREGSGEHRVIEINALVEESLNLAWHGARAETQGFEIKLKQSFDPSAGEADIFPQDIRRALLNMISNGFYAAIRRSAETNSDYAPTLTASTKDLGDRVEIRIRDNGTGMTPDVKEQMFNPFFTTKPTGEGTGLGLSISHDIIVKQHGGSIEVDTQPGEFTEIRIILPRVAVFV